MISHWYARITSQLDSIVKGEEDFDRAKAIVPFFYYFLFFIAFSRLEGLDYALTRSSASFSPRLPLFWIHNLDFAFVTNTVFLLFTFGALLAAWKPFSRTARAAAFFGFLEYQAYEASFGGPNHQLDHWLWVSIIFIFLPTLNAVPTKETRRIFSLVFWCAGAYLMLTYTMAGIGKLIYAGIQIAHGQTSAFSPYAGALFAATQLNQMGISTPLGPTLIAHPFLAWPAFLAMLEVQTFAIVAAFRPQLHRLWGIGLVCFHLGTFLTMRAVFVGPSALLLMFFVSSPYATDQNWRETLRHVPLFGALARAARLI